MKKLLLYSLFLSITVLSCGPSEEERAKQQAENAVIVDRKVNELMKSFESQNSEVETPVVSDSIAIDSLSAE